MSGRGSAWLECLPWEQEVAGSNPVAPTIIHIIDKFKCAKNFGSMLSKARKTIGRIQGTQMTLNEDCTTITGER